MDVFRDLCILCGTDYNPNLAGIGPVKADVLLRSVGGDIAAMDHPDLASLNYTRVRQIFSRSPLPEAQRPVIPFCGTPDISRLIAYAECNGAPNAIIQEIPGLRKATQQPTIEIIGVSVE